MENKKYCVIMAGGIGARFWPRSRQSRPKQFLDILGTGKSFIRHTYERFAKIVPAEHFLVVTNRRYRDLVLEHLPELRPEQVLCEPIGRNTAPCIAYAAYTLLKSDPEAEMIVTPADHFILDEEAFRGVIGECLDFAREHDALMTVGIRPTRPETGYGYIQTTAPSARGSASPRSPTSNWPRPSSSAASSSGTRASSCGPCAPSWRRSAATCPSTTCSSAA